MATTVTTPTPTAAPEPTPIQHSNLQAFLVSAGHFGAILLALAPAVAAPFIKNTQSQAIETAEIPVVNALSQALAALQPK